VKPARRRGSCPGARRVLSRGRGRALAYRSAASRRGEHRGDAAGQRLARNPLPRATRRFRCRSL